MKILDDDPEVLILVQEAPENQTALFLYMSCFMVVITSFILKFLTREVRQLKDFGLFDYLTQFWNVFDLTSLGMNVVYVGYCTYAMILDEEGIK